MKGKKKGHVDLSAPTCPLEIGPPGWPSGRKANYASIIVQERRKEIKLKSKNVPKTVKSYEKLGNVMRSLHGFYSNSTPIPA